MAGVEIKSYEGDGTDLVELIQRTWSGNFKGKSWFPLWGLDYFRWRLLDPRAGGRELLVCAYQGSKLVGCVLAEGIELEIRGQPTKGSFSSFLSVDPTLKVPGVAIRLIEALRKRHLERGAVISIGVTSKERELANRKFWDSLQKRKPEDFHYFNEIVMWSRALDGRAVSAAGMNAFERIVGRWAEYIPYGWLGWRNSDRVRPYQADDLPRCLEWVDAQGKGADLRMLWTKERLELQLGHEFPKTLIVEGEGGRGALLNYYALDYLARAPLRVAMIDLCAGNAGLGLKLDLLKAAGRQMQQEGVQMAMMMHSAAAPAGALLAAGYLPIPPGAELFSLFPDAKLDLKKPLKHHLLFT